MTERRSRSLAVIVAAPLFALAACGGNPPPPAQIAAPAAPPPAPAPSLYDRLGGQPAITAVVDDFVVNLQHDARTRAYFRRANIPHFKMELNAQLCAATGGPCTYTGKDMKTAHAKMRITNAAFDATVQDLKKSLDKHKVADADQQALLGALAPMRGDIVTAK